MRGVCTQPAPPSCAQHACCHSSRCRALKSAGWAHLHGHLAGAPTAPGCDNVMHPPHACPPSQRSRCQHREQGRKRPSTHLCGNLARVDADGGTPRLLQVPAPAGVNAGDLQVSRLLSLQGSCCGWEGLGGVSQGAACLRQGAAPAGGALGGSMPDSITCRPQLLPVAAPAV